MLPCLSTSTQAAPGALGRLLTLLAGLGRALVFPFDAILAGLVNAGLGIEGLCDLLDLTRDALDDHIVRLALRSPPDKPMRRRSTRSWSREDEQKALIWRAAGVHPEAIGANLSRPRSGEAVRAKLRRFCQARPPRSALFRPEAGYFAAFEPRGGSPFEPIPVRSAADACGRAAGPVAIRPQAADSSASPAPVPAPAASADRAATPARRMKRKGVRPTDAGQRDFGFLAVVGGSDRGVISVPERPAAPPPVTQVAKPRPPIPATQEAIDWTDLSWIASVKTPFIHPLAVYVVGMLFMSGLHYRDAAALAGVTPGQLRTWRTKMGVAVDRDRSHLVHAFDLEVAMATMKRGRQIVARSIKHSDRGRRLFWKDERDRNTHTAPGEVKRDPMFKYRSPEITIVTRQVLDAEKRAQTPITTPIIAPISRSVEHASRSQMMRPGSSHEPSQRGDPCATRKPPWPPGCPIPSSKAGWSTAASA